MRIIPPGSRPASLSLASQPIRRRIGFSAALVSISAAVRTPGMSRSALGTVLARYSTACRKVERVVPSGSSIGSSNSRDQDKTSNLKRSRQDWKLFGRKRLFASSEVFYESSDYLVCQFEHGSALVIRHA
jgi:hypothetical protein